jgi:hypothetical protein
MALVIYRTELKAISKAKKFPLLKNFLINHFYSFDYQQFRNFIFQKKDPSV